MFIYTIRFPSSGGYLNSDARELAFWASHAADGQMSMMPMMLMMIPIDAMPARIKPKVSCQSVYTDSIVRYWFIAEACQRKRAAGLQESLSEPDG